MAAEEESTNVERSLPDSWPPGSANGPDDAFLATLSHELRTPLTAIVGWSHLLQRGQLSAEETVRAIDIIIRNANAQNQIIDELLDVSRIGSGKVQLDLRPVDVSGIVHTAIQKVSPAADAKGINLQLTANPVGVRVMGDQERLQQALACLFSNAIKFTPADGAVRVSVAVKDEKVEIEVKDSGNGIAAAFLPRIFDRFSQDDSSSTRRAGGLGLGLFIARKLVQLHGGDIVAESAGAGHGSTLTTSLPRVMPLPKGPAEENGATLA